MKIAVIGLGYMGIPTATLLATNGYEVLGVDINAIRVKQINEGTCPFEENGLAELLTQAREQGTLEATTMCVPADVFIIAVPTPEKGHKADLSYVKNATESIAKVLKDGNLVILESTVSPNTCKTLLKDILDAAGKSYLLAHCPERAIPGNTMYEIVHNDRIIGGLTAEASEKTKAIYSSFVKGEIFITDITTAECCKLMENTYRDINIAYANTIMKLSQELGFDPYEAINLANRHPRVKIMQPGPGVGGHCIPIDPWFLTENTRNNELIVTARNVNDSMPAFWVERLDEKVAKLDLKKAKIGILGVAYKPNVDDARETPAEHIIVLLQKKGYQVKATDPYVKHFSHDLLTLEEVKGWADILMVVTAHDAYKEVRGDSVLRCFNDIGQRP